MNIQKKPPQPVLVVAVDLGVYAFCCECKHLKVYGNSPAEAVANWQAARKFELDL